MWGNGGYGNQYSDQALEKQIRDCLVQGDSKRRVMSDCKVYVRELIESAKLQELKVDEKGNITEVVNKCPPVSTETYKAIAAILRSAVTKKNEKQIMQVCYMIEKVTGILSETQTINKSAFVKSAMSIITDDDSN